MEPPPSTAEIAFFDVETTAPGTRLALLEFGAILVCPRRLVEVGSYSTLIRPADLYVSDRCNGITADSVASAPPFHSVADNVYAILHGRVWAGHNIVGFDCALIREAFAEIGRPAPEAKGMIDTLPLLTQSFGRRAVNMKMASLACYFGLGKQKHRSLDDVRMNLEVLKCCATVLFLEYSLPDMYSMNSWVYETTITRNQMNIDSTADRAGARDSHEMLRTAEGCSGYAGFLEPYEVSPQCIRATLHQCGPRIVLLHRDAPLQLCRAGLRVPFRISAKFVDLAGRPKLSIVVNVPASLCHILDVCDHIAHRLWLASGSRSEWRHVLKKNGYSDSFNVRLSIPTAANGHDGIYLTEIYEKEQSGSIQKLVFSRLDVAELDVLFIPGDVIDAYFSVDVYDYKNSAGIRLVAKRLVVHSK